MGLEENKVLRSVIDVMDLLPAVFAVLADEDEGHDPERLERDLLRDCLDEHEVYTTLAEELARTPHRRSPMRRSVWGRW